MRLLWPPALCPVYALSPSSVRVKQTFLFWQLGSFLLQGFLVSMFTKVASLYVHLAWGWIFWLLRIPLPFLSSLFPFLISHHLHYEIFDFFFFLRSPILLVDELISTIGSNIVSRFNLISISMMFSKNCRLGQLIGSRLLSVVGLVRRRASIFQREKRVLTSTPTGWGGLVWQNWVLLLVWLPINSLLPCFNFEF